MSDETSETYGMEHQWAHQVNAMLAELNGRLTAAEARGEALAALEERLALLEAEARRPDAAGPAHR
jgi:hypothetical protein